MINREKKFCSLKIKTQVAITADIGNNPIRHGDANYGRDIRQQEQYPRDDSQFVHFFAFKIVEIREELALCSEHVYLPPYLRAS